MRHDENPGVRLSDAEFLRQYHAGEQIPQAHIFQFTVLHVVKPLDTTPSLNFMRQFFNHRNRAVNMGLYCGIVPHVQFRYPGSIFFIDAKQLQKQFACVYPWNLRKQRRC